MEEAESGALSLEDTGDFASRLAALSTSRTGTSVGDKGTDLEDSGMVNGGMERQKRSNEDGGSHGEIKKDKMQIVSEEKVQQVVDAIQDSFLQILEAGKEDPVENQGSVKAKQVKEKKNVGSSDQIEDTS